MNIRRYISYAVIFLSSICIFTTSETTLSLYQTTNISNEISSYAENLVWRFTTINGKIYKRLFNVDTNQWVGNWILVK